MSGASARPRLVSLRLRSRSPGSARSVLAWRSSINRRMTAMSLFHRYSIKQVWPRSTRLLSWARPRDSGTRQVSRDVGGLLGSGGSEIALGGGNLILRFAGDLVQCLLQKLDVRLQAAGTTLHFRLGRAYFHPANVLRGSTRQKCRQQHCRKEKLRVGRPGHPMLQRVAYHALELT